MRTLQSWTNQLQDDILLAQGAWLRKPNRDAFCEVTGMTDLPRYCRYTRTALTVQRLNTRDCVLPPTAWSRLAALSPKASREELAATVNRRSLPSGRNRVVDALVGHGLGLKAVRYEYNRTDFSRTPVQMEMVRTGVRASPIDHVRPKWWMPTKSPNRMFHTEKLGLRYSVYPDGSTDVGTRRGCSGYAAVIVDDMGQHTVAGSWIKRAGTNYLAELAYLPGSSRALPRRKCVYTRTVLVPYRRFSAAIAPRNSHA
jgi:hypothetical protein